MIACWTPDQSDPRQPQVSRPDQTPHRHQPRSSRGSFEYLSKSGRWIWRRLNLLKTQELIVFRLCAHSAVSIRGFYNTIHIQVHLVGKNLCLKAFIRRFDSYFQSLANDRNLFIEICLVFHCSTWWWSDVVFKFRVTIEEEILRHIQNSNKVSLQSAPGSKLLLNGLS